MTKKDLFRLIIKILGLYFLITTAFGIFPTILTFIQSWKFFLETSSVLGNIVIILLLSIFLIYEPDKIIDWLKLDKNFDNNKIELEKLGAEDILKIAIITLGGILIINNLFGFLSSLLSIFKLSAHNNRWNLDILPNGLNIIIGYLMITNYNAISRFIMKKRE